MTNKITHDNAWLSGRYPFHAFLQAGVREKRKIKITFIGLGKIGIAIVERLLKSNYEVTIFNQTLSTIKPLVEKGAIPSDSLCAAVKNADVVLTTLLDDQSILEVVQEIIPHLSMHTIHVVLSTISPETAKIIAHQHHYIRYVVATALSMPEVTLLEEVTIFYVGHKTDIEKVMPILKIFVKSIVMCREF